LIAVVPPAKVDCIAGDANEGIRYRSGGGGRTFSCLRGIAECHLA
jgi:hypothetical protein